MLISFKNHVINSDHITHCELRLAGSDEGLDEDELYIFFLGDGELSLAGDEALRFWGYLLAFLVTDSAIDRTAPPKRLTA